jgi:hypothetical protein
MFIKISTFRQNILSHPSADTELISAKIDPMVPVVPPQQKANIIDQESIKSFEDYQAKVKTNHDLCP